MKIGLAGWAIVHRFKAEENPLQLLDYFRVAKEEFGIDAVELNNVFMASHDDAYLQQIVDAAKAAGVTMLGVAVDGTGDLSLTDEAQRKKSVANAMEYFDIAEKLALQYFRVNTGGKPDGGEDAIQACIRSFRELGEEGERRGIAIATENHGGLSYDPDVMVRIIEEVGLPSVRTLPDFGNFPDEIRYEAIEKIMPYAIAVHAKWHRRDGTRFDIPRLMDIVKRSGFDGYVFIEDSGKRFGKEDREGILELKAELEKCM